MTRFSIFSIKKKAISVTQSTPIRNSLISKDLIFVFNTIIGIYLYTNAKVYFQQFFGGRTKIIL